MENGPNALMAMFENLHLFVIDLHWLIALYSSLYFVNLKELSWAI